MSIWTRIAEAIAALVARGESLLAVFERRRAPERSVAFTIAVIGLGAKMAKADGLVRARRGRRLPPGLPDRPRGRGRPPPASSTSPARTSPASTPTPRRIAAMFRDRPAVLEDILEGLFHIALADGRYHEGEEGFLARVAEIFGVPATAFDAIEARHLVGPRQTPGRCSASPATPTSPPSAPAGASSSAPTTPTR